VGSIKRLGRGCKPRPAWSSGAQERVRINFKPVGVKWLMLAYAKLEVL
jgi:hypothetical protein